MNGVRYGIAALLLIIWAIVFLGYDVGGLIHILLVIAVISFLLRVIKKKKIND